jgi:hypothetical protein
VVTGAADSELVLSFLLGPALSSPVVVGGASVFAAVSAAVALVLVRLPADVAGGDVGSFGFGTTRATGRERTTGLEDGAGFATPRTPTRSSRPLSVSVTSWVVTTRDAIATSAHKNKPDPNTS